MSHQKLVHIDLNFDNENESYRPLRTYCTLKKLPGFAVVYVLFIFFFWSAGSFLNSFSLGAFLLFYLLVLSYFLFRGNCTCIDFLRDL